MSASKHHQLSEEEVLLAFAIEPRHDRKTLERYIKDYPEYSTALVDLSAEFMIEETREEKEVFSSTHAVNSAWQRFSSTVKMAPIKAANPFYGLNAAQLKTVADKIGINKLLLIRLRDRGINLASIPHRFIERTATALGVTADSLRSYLSGPPCLASDLSFRSDVKPAVSEQISFAQAIELSQLTAEQQAEMKALMVG